MWLNTHQHAYSKPQCHAHNENISKKAYQHGCNDCDQRHLARIVPVNTQKKITSIFNAGRSTHIHTHPGLGSFLKLPRDVGTVKGHNTMAC